MQTERNQRVKWATIREDDHNASIATRRHETNFLLYLASTIIFLTLFSLQTKTLYTLGNSVNRDEGLDRYEPPHLHLYRLPLCFCFQF